MNGLYWVPSYCWKDGRCQPRLCSDRQVDPWGIFPKKKQIIFGSHTLQIRRNFVSFLINHQVEWCENETLGNLTLSTYFNGSAFSSEPIPLALSFAISCIPWYTIKHQKRKIEFTQFITFLWDGKSEQAYWLDIKYPLSLTAGNWKDKLVRFRSSVCINRACLIN